MPIRIACPSCSATLSVKDEFAGRAVRCPKCGTVIPATAHQPAATPSPPPKGAFEAIDEPTAGTGGKTAEPVERSNAVDEWTF